MLRFPIYLNARDYCSYSGCVRRPFTEGICHKHWWGRRCGNKVCIVDNGECAGPVKGRGYCNTHYTRFMKYGDPLKTKKRPPLYPVGQMPKTCTKEDCIRPSKTRGLCVWHYREEREWGEGGRPERFILCPVCGQNRYKISWAARGMCGECVYRADRRPHNPQRHTNGHWDRGTCLKAGREWYKLHGHAPRAVDWHTTGPCSSFPSRTIIYTVFGSWANYAKELGLPQRPIAHYKPPKVMPDECLTAGLAFVEEHGYIPSIPQWNAMGMSPGHVTIYRCLGSWVAFKLALADVTGLDPDKAAPRRRDN